MPSSASTTTTTSFIDRNDYISRLSNLPVPGANSRLVNKNASATTASAAASSNAPSPTTSSGQVSEDPCLVSKQWNAALAAAKYFEREQRICDNNSRRIVQLKLSLLPTAPSTTLDISLPPVSTGGEVDLFWPSDSSVVDESALQLPKVPPLKFPKTTTTNSKNNNETSVTTTTTTTTTTVNNLIQQQWIPIIESSLKSNVMKLHRYIALLKGGIQNKKWSFEAESFLASIPEEEWDVVVEKSSIPSSSAASYNNNNTPSANLRNLGGDVMKFISSATSAFEDLISGGNSNNSSNNTIYSGGGSYNSSSSGTTPTMAVHLKLELFSKSRSNELRQRLLKAISKIMKHATEQLKGGEVRDQLDYLWNHNSTMKSGDNSQFLPSTTSSDGNDNAPSSIPSPSFLQSNASSNNTNQQNQRLTNVISNMNDDDDDDEDDQQNNLTNLQQQQHHRYDIKSNFSCVIHVSESISNEYQFSAIKNQQVLFDIFSTEANEEEEESSKSNSSDERQIRKRIRKQALQMLNQVIFEELFPSSSSSPLPKANKDDFSFYDFIPALEDTIVACVEKISNWCSLLYGFSITFGNPLWNRGNINTSNNCSRTNRPPIFSNSAAFLFESPRSSNGPLLSLFIQVSQKIKSHNQNENDSYQHQQQQSYSSEVSPTVNIISTQLERNGQPLMFSWVPSSSSSPTSSSSSSYESTAGAVLQYLVDSIPKLQGLYRSMLHQHQQHQNQQQQRQ